MWRRPGVGAGGQGLGDGEKRGGRNGGHLYSVKNKLIKKQAKNVI